MVIVNLRIYLILALCLLCIVQAKAQEPSSALRDTIIEGKTYHWVWYNLNNKAYQIGESNAGGVKNGHWFLFDQQDRVIGDLNYVNDTLYGLAIYYDHFSNQNSRKFSGIIINNLKIGRWLQEEKVSKNRWQTLGYIIFDGKESILMRILLFPNGKVQYEITYDETGKAVWYKVFNEQGEIVNENQKILIELELIGK